MFYSPTKNTFDVIFQNFSLKILPCCTFFCLENLLQLWFNPWRSTGNPQRSPCSACFFHLMGPTVIKCISQNFIVNCGHTLIQKFCPIFLQRFESYRLKVVEVYKLQLFILSCGGLPRFPEIRC